MMDNNAKLLWIGMAVELKAIEVIHHWEVCVQGIGKAKEILVVAALFGLLSHFYRI